MERADAIKGYGDLSSEQQEMFDRTYADHMRAMGAETRQKYRPHHIERVEWDEEEKTVNVYYANGIWWHYTNKGTWY